MGERQVTDFEDLYEYANMMGYELESRHDEDEEGNAVLTVGDTDAVEQLRVDTSSDFRVTQDEGQIIVTK